MMQLPDFWKTGKLINNLQDTKLGKKDEIVDLEKEGERESEKDVVVQTFEKVKERSK